MSSERHAVGAANHAGLAARMWRQLGGVQLPAYIAGADYVAATGSQIAYEPDVTASTLRAPPGQQTIAPRAYGRPLPPTSRLPGG